MIEEQVVDKLIDKGYHIAFAESCTGGLCSARLINVANASKVIDMSFTTYADYAKIDLLGVSADTIARYGVVSEQTASEMCRGVADRASCSVGIGVTGIAGPTGATAAKPIGMVCFGFCINGRVHTFTKQFGDVGRNNVRRLSTDFVYETLLALLSE